MLLTASRQGVEWKRACFVVAYVIHILEESVLPEVFVQKVKRLYWPAYGWTKFFRFNAVVLSLNIAAVIVYEGLRGSSIVFPLSLACERIFNGFYHFGETVRTGHFRQDSFRASLRGFSAISLSGIPL